MSLLDDQLPRLFIPDVPGYDTGILMGNDNIVNPTNGPGAQYSPDYFGVFNPSGQAYSQLEVDFVLIVITAAIALLLILFFS